MEAGQLQRRRQLDVRAQPGLLGPVKATLAKFEELPFTTESAEYNVLQAGAAGAGQKIDVGYIPTTDAPNKPANAAVGANPVNGYTLAPLIEWAINYFPINFQSTTGNGPVNKQLYFRQALQDLMNQKAIIDGPLHGYGAYTVGPVGTYPATSYLSSQGQQGDPFPYNPTKAKQLLTSHGWNVVPNGVTTCADPGTGPTQCGAGVAKGHGLVYNLPYATGTNWIAQEMTQLQSNASLVGIKLNLEPKPFNQVTAIGAPNCVVAKTSCNWDMRELGRRLVVRPRLLPVGRDAVPVRLRRQLRRLLQRRERLADQPDAHVDRAVGARQLAELPVHPGPVHLAAERRLRDDRGHQRPCGRAPAGHDRQHQPRRLVLHQVIGFLIRRLLQAVVVVLLVTMITFILLRAIPGNVAVAVLGPSSYRNPQVLAAFNREYGFDKPWFASTCCGSATCSRATWDSPGPWTRASRRCSGRTCRRRSGWSGVSVVLALIVAVPIGVWQAVRRNGPVDYAFTSLSFLFYAAPTFFVGTVLILVVLGQAAYLRARGPAGRHGQRHHRLAGPDAAGGHAGAGDDRAVLPLHALLGDGQPDRGLRPHRPG